MGSILSTMKADIFCEEEKREISVPSADRPAPKKVVKQRSRKVNAGIFKCDRCERKCSTKLNLQQHVRKCHPMKKEVKSEEQAIEAKPNANLLFAGQVYQVDDYIVYVTKNIY